jgi:hypothetical protein
VGWKVLEMGEVEFKTERKEMNGTVWRMVEDGET